MSNSSLSRSFNNSCWTSCHGYLGPFESSGHRLLSRSPSASRAGEIPPSTRRATIFTTGFVVHPFIPSLGVGKRVYYETHRRRDFGFGILPGFDEPAARGEFHRQADDVVRRQSCAASTSAAKSASLTKVADCSVSFSIFDMVGSPCFAPIAPSPSGGGRLVGLG